MRKLIVGIALVSIMSGACMAESFFDTPLFNYGVGVVSIIAGVNFVGASDKFNDAGMSHFQDAQYYADMAGYYYGWAPNTSNMYVALSNASRAEAVANYGAAEQHKAMGYAMAANGIWLIARGISNNLNVRVASDKVSVSLSQKF